MKRHWYTAGAVLASIALTAAVVPPVALAESFDGRVVQVDGTLITIDRPSGERTTVRLADVDTSLRGLRAGRWVDDLVASLLEGKQVDVLTDDRDGQGVKLARVFVDDIDVSAELIRNGWARVGGYRVTDEALYKLQALAQREERGLWHQSGVAGAPIEMWRQAQARIE